MTIALLLTRLALSMITIMPIGPAETNQGHDKPRPLNVSLGSRPIDGVWSLTLKKITRSGNCISAIDFVVDPLIESIRVSAPITWKSTFHPAQMGLDTHSRTLVWHANHMGAFISERQTTQSSIVEAQYRTQLLDQNRVSITIDFYVDDSPPEHGMKDCVISANFLASHGNKGSEPEGF